MIKKYLILIFVTLLCSSPIYSAGNESSEKSAYKYAKEDITHLIGKNSNFKKGVDAMKQAKKYEKKKKKEKSIKRFEDAIKFFVLANKELPNNPDILNYLGFCYRKVDDFMMAEIYYSQGLEIEPKHIGINEYLGQLYVETGRINKAKERLEILKNCKCKEFETLSVSIKKVNSKY
jgi:tetratricopeptide (TPR) repeat protein